jgi:hypothetical protein
MPRGGLIKAAVLCFALALLCAASAAGEGALVIVNNIVLRADGGFQPRALPREKFAPIDFQGHFDIAARDGGKPVALESAVIDFDRDGRLSAGGLPVCPVQRVAAASTAEARRACTGAIVGTGAIGASIDFAEGTVTGSSPLTIFNGPPQDGNPTVILHAHIDFPVTETFAIVVPIERRPGPFRYRATLTLPPIAGGRGVVTHVGVKVGRRFSVGGRSRSYVAAHCSDGILRTHGRFTFADGTIVDGAVEKPCRAR